MRSNLGRPTRAFSALMLWIGMLLYLYSPTVVWQQQWNESRGMELLWGDGSGSDDLNALTSQVMADAHAYNEVLASGLPINPEEFDYYDMLSWSGTDVIARLRIPSINLDQPIRRGMGEDVLQEALGHLEGTSLPVGGESTNPLIGGHRGLATAEGFTHLDGVSIGDVFYIEVGNELLTYQVRSSEVVAPELAEDQPIQPGRDLVTLVTCTPLGVNTDRIVVVGERIPNFPGEVAGGPSDLPGFPWWAVIGGAGTILALGYVVIPGPNSKKKENS